MALNLGSMFAWIGADTSGLDKAEGRMRRFVGNITRGNSEISRSSGFMGKALAGAISFETIRRATMLADEYKGVEARIRNITRESKTFDAVQSRLAKISMNTGTSYVRNASLYTNIDRALPELGGTQKQAMQLTETLQKLAVISGASSDQMKDGMLQFGQAMAAGIMRAEEWNSIMENIPEVGARIAKGMGMTVGQLRLAVLDGKVLSKDVFASLLKQSEQVNKEFAEMPIRLGQGMESLKTGSMIFLGELDKSLGVTTWIAATMQGLGQYLAGDFSSQVHSITEYFNQVSDSLGLWHALISDISNTLGITSNSANGFIEVLKTGFSFIADSLVTFPANIRLLGDLAATLIAEMIVRSQELIDYLINGFDQLWEMIKIGAASAAAFVATNFAGVINGVISGLASTMGSLSTAADAVGFATMAEELAAVEEKMAFSKDTAGDLAKSMAGVAVAGGKQLDVLKKQAEASKKFTSDQLSALEAESDAAVNRYESEIAGIDAASTQRELDYANRKTLAEKDAALAEKLFNDEQARQAAAVALKGKDGKTKAAGRTPVDNTFKDAESALRKLEKELQSELELEQKHYDESLAALNIAEQLKIASIMPYHELRERLEQQHQDKLAEIERERMDKQLTGVADFFGNLSKLQELENGKAVEIGKAAAIVEVLINTARAAMSSYAFGAKLGGPILGATFAAAAGVAGGVQLAAIRSAKATGGEVGMGGKYKVNEQGPELLSVGGEDFLMMGSKGGKITPNNKLGGKATQVINKIIVQNLPGQTATVSRQKDDSTIIRIAVDTAKNEIAHEARTGAGQTVPAILKAGGMKRRAS